MKPEGIGRAVGRCSQDKAGCDWAASRGCRCLDAGVVGLRGDGRAVEGTRLPWRGRRAEVEGQAVRGRRLSKDGEDRGEGRETESR